MVGREKKKKQIAGAPVSLLISCGGLDGEVEASGLSCQQINEPKRAMAEKEAAGLTATENSRLAKCGSINGGC